MSPLLTDLTTILQYGLRTLDLQFKEETQDKLFSREFCEIFKNTVFKNTSGRLLLKCFRSAILK